MDENIKGTEKFYIKTKLEKNDYRKFLFFATFIKRWYTLPMILGISLVGSIAVCSLIGSVSIVKIFLMTLFYFFIALASVMIKSEIRQKKAIKSDNMGMFDTIAHLKFYENYIVVENEKIDGYTKIGYNQFFEIVESKYFYLLYVIDNQAHIIRKEDVNDTAKFSDFLKEKFGTKYSKRQKILDYLYLYTKLA